MIKATQHNPMQARSIEHRLVNQAHRLTTCLYDAYMRAIKERITGAAPHTNEHLERLFNLHNKAHRRSRRRYQRYDREVRMLP